MTTEQRAALPIGLEGALASRHIPSLDAMRALAVFLVVFYHAGVPGVPGGLGVLAFFVLSGFLITWLLLKENERYGSISLKLFYTRRALRIFPAFYVYWIFIIAMLVFLQKRVIWPQAWSSLFYVNNYYQAINGDPNTALSHTWSLGVEEQFYFLWPATFLMLRNNLRKGATVVATLIVMVWIHRLVLKFGFHVNQGYFYEAFDTRADSLMMGCLLAILLRQKRGAVVWAWLADSPWKPLVPIGGLVISVILAEHVSGYRDVAGFAIDSVLVGLLLAQWISASIDYRQWRWLNAGWLVYLGNISYSVYLYQQIVPEFVAKVCRGGWAPFFVPVTVAAVIAAATFSYYVVERPFLKLKARAARG